jgi:hypothetical protein
MTDASAMECTFRKFATVDRNGDGIITSYEPESGPNFSEEWEAHVMKQMLSVAHSRGAASFKTIFHEWLEYFYRCNDLASRCLFRFARVVDGEYILTIDDALKVQ